MITWRVTITSKINIKVISLWWLANIQSQIYTTLRQSMAMAPSGESINANFRIMIKPKMMEDLPVLRIIMMGHKFPPLTQTDYKQIFPHFSPICHSLKRETSSAFPKYNCQHGKLTPVQPHRITFCSRSTSKSLVLEQCQKVLVQEWFIFNFLYFCGQHQELAS